MYTIIIFYAAAIGQSVKAFASQTEGWMEEYQNYKGRNSSTHTLGRGVISTDTTI